MMKTLEIVRKLDGFDKRLADLTKDYNTFKESIDKKEEKSKKVDTSKSNTKKFKE